MIKLNHNLSLDLYYNEEKTIDTKEYDKNSRYITVSLTFKGEEYKIAGDSVKARVKWLKPDKKAVFNDCVINSDNTVTIDLTEQMLIASGVAKATLSLYDINTNQVLSSTSFNAIIEASAVSDDTILSSDEYNSLHNEFKRLNDKVEELDKTVTEHENIREKNEDSRKTNEIKRESNESKRINSENTRINNENKRIDSEDERVKNENTRIANENTRQQNEAIRETQEDKRESDVAIAVEKANEAAKNANDKANDLQTKLDNHHFVLTDELENTISSDSTTTAPTANAVKIVNDKLDSHTNNHDNPHNVTKEQVGLGNNDNTADIDKPVSTAQQKAIDDAYANSNKYTDKKIADLIGGAPETLDTLKEVADAISASKSTEEALNSAIGTKANQAELDTHTGNDTIHIKSDERENWNDANNKKHTHSNKSVLDGITSALIAAWNSAVKHITDTVKHITPSERTKWNTAYDKAINALPLSGGILTGSLTVQGNAIDNPIRARGIVGSDGQGSDGDLYLQYGTDNNIYLGKSGKSYIDSEGYFYQIGNKVLDSKNYTSVMTKQGVCDILGYTPATETESKKYIKVYNSGEIGDSNSVTVNDLASQGFATGMIAATEDSPIGSGWFHALNMGWVDNATTWTSQLAIGTEHQDGLYYRTTNSSSGISGKPWKRVLDNSNYTNYALKAESLSDIDLNNVTTSGIYHLSGTLTNNPLSCNATLLVDFNVGTPYQIFMPDYTYNMYKRTYSSSTWGEWYEFGGSSSSSVAWDNITGRPSSYPPSNHNHGTADPNFTCFLTDNTSAGFSALHDNGATTGFFLKTIRGQYTAPGWFEGDYASGIAFGGADTHAVISCRYNFPRVTFAGGNGTEPNWWMRLAGTSGHSYNMDDFATSGIESYGSSDNYVFSDCYGSGSGTNYYYIRYTNGIQMIFIEIHNDNSRQNVSQGSGKKTISFPVSFVNNKYFAFGKQNISSDASGNNLVSFSEKNTSSIDVRHYPYGYNEAADYFSMFFVGRWK